MIVTVVGGANIDLQGFPDRELRMHDSNPGTVRSGEGGVGRNIAVNLARLGARVRFISMFGADEYGRRLVEGLAAAGIDTSLSVRSTAYATPTYLCILDEHGRLRVAVSDMRLLEELDEELLAARTEALRSADLCVFDANLGSSVLGRAVELCSPVPCLLDTVSTTKAARATRVIGGFHAVKPNEGELEVISGMKISREDDLDRAAEVLHRRGTRLVFVSLGKRGLYFSDGASRAIARAPDVNPVNVSGAGDAMTAALAIGICEGRPIEETAAFAAAAAALTTQSDGAVNDALTTDAVQHLAAAVRIRRR